MLKDILNEVQADNAQQEQAVDAKGKITHLEPSIKGLDGCPFWTDAKRKIAKTDKDNGQIRIPKAFVVDLAKQFKIPLHDSFATPLCVNNGKVCAFFNGAIGQEIACNYGKPASPAAQVQGAVKAEGEGMQSTPSIVAGNGSTAGSGVIASIPSGSSQNMKI